MIVRFLVLLPSESHSRKHLELTTKFYIREIKKVKLTEYIIKQT